MTASAPSASMPSDGELDDLLALATRLAGEAGAIAADGRRSIDDGRSPAGGDTKSSATDVVTEFDRAAEAHVVGAIRSLRPDDAIVGEEGTSDAGTSGFAWFIDPIDGTTNFVYDQPAWACSIGVAYGDSMVVGVVDVPPLGERYTAALGRGARRNGLAIRPSAETDPALALVGTGFTYAADLRAAQAEVVARLIGSVRDIRRLGSAAVDLCMVACGRLDVYYERYLNSWDAAAGELIAREAGAVTSDFSGGPARPDEMFVAAPGVHAGVLERLRAALEPA